MLAEEEQEILSRVGPGTPMGNLLRRYWTPACLSVELPEPDGAPLRVRLLGEDFVAFRDTNGRVGLVKEHCAHRGASLFYGRTEDCGLRCPYHGWLYDVNGQCIDMPNEQRSFADRIRIGAFPTRESGGIVWTYLGPPETTTPFRDFGTETLPDDQVFATKLESSCNWIQTMDGNLDTSHISFLHQYDAIDDLPDDGTDRPGYPSNFMSMKFWRHDRKPRIEVEQTWYGLRYAGIRTTPNAHPHARVSAFVLPYSTLVAAVPYSTRHLMVVPIDDEHCYRYQFNAQEPSNPRGIGGPPFFLAPGFPYDPFRPAGVLERSYTAENSFRIDRDAQKHRTFSGIADFVSQDLMVTESMGPIYDRSQENLGAADRAIVAMRSRLVEAARALAAGEEPPALAGAGDFRSIRAAEKILADGEDWRLLGTDDDPVVVEDELALRRADDRS